MVQPVLTLATVFLPTRWLEVVHLQNIQTFILPISVHVSLLEMLVSALSVISQFPRASVGETVTHGSGTRISLLCVRYILQLSCHYATLICIIAYKSSRAVFDRYGLGPVVNKCREAYCPCEPLFLCIRSAALSEYFQTPWFARTQLKSLASFCITFGPF